MGKVGLACWRGLEQNVHHLPKRYFRAFCEARDEEQTKQSNDKAQHPRSS
jgi:hypothetical protein